MDYRAVLELNPYQIAALLVEKSETPGRLSFETINDMKEALRKLYG